jgi:hypothetical protein
MATNTFGDDLSLGFELDAVTLELGHAAAG